MDSFEKDLRGEGDLVGRHPRMDAWHWLDEREKLPRPIQQDVKATYSHYQKMEARLRKFVTRAIERVVKSDPQTFVEILMTYCAFSCSAGGPFLGAEGPDRITRYDIYWCDFAQAIDRIDGEPLKTLAFDLPTWIRETWGFNSTATDNKTPTKGIFSNVTIRIELAVGSNV